MSSRISNPKSQPVTPQQQTGRTVPQPPPAEVSTTGWSLIKRTLKQGLQGDDVKALQRQLGIPADGKFGPQTLAAVKAFQRQHGLEADGIVGTKTYSAMSQARREARPRIELSPRGQDIEVPQPRVEVPQQPRVEVPPPRVETPVVETPTPRPTDNFGDPAQRLALAQQLVKPRGNATAADVAAVVAEAAKLPLNDLRELQRAGISIVAARDSVADAYPYLLNQPPRGWPPGKGWGDVPGAYMPTEKAVVVGTTAGPNGERRVPPTGDHHGSVSLMAHEAAHALDAARRYPSVNDREFRAAYQADLAAGKLEAYYTQAGDAGRSEAYAESLALFLSGDPRGEGKEEFPALMRYWEQRYSR